MQRLFRTLQRSGLQSARSMPGRPLLGLPLSRSYHITSISNGGAHAHGADHHDGHNHGAGHDHHDHGHEEKAYFPGASPDYQSEGWEIMTVVFTIISTSMMVFGPYMYDSIDFKGWAKQEALARESTKTNGEEIQFGNYYRNIKYQESELSENPSLVTADSVDE